LVIPAQRESDRLWPNSSPGIPNPTVAQPLRSSSRLNPKAADHKEPPEERDLTPTQRVLAAKSVSSLADLNRKA
jgi:hypothetical protein